MCLGEHPAFAPKSRGPPIGAPLGKPDKGGVPSSRGDPTGGKGQWSGGPPLGGLAATGEGMGLAATAWESEMAKFTSCTVAGGGIVQANVAIRGSRKHREARDARDASSRSSGGSGGGAAAVGDGSRGEVAVQVKGGRRERKGKEPPKGPKEEDASSGGTGEHPVAIKGLKKGKAEKAGRDAPGQLQRWGLSAAETAKQLASASAERAAQLGANAAGTAKHLA